MQNWPDEFMAEYYRQRILQEAEQIRLEKLARKGTMDHPGLFEWMLFSVANWMIVTGKQLHRRYEISQEEQWIHPRTKATS